MKRVPRRAGKQSVDGPIRQRVRDVVGGPGNPKTQEHLAPAEGQAGFCESEQQRAGGSPGGESHQEDGQDDGENVHRGAQHHAHEARPNNFGAQGGGAGDADGQINGPATGAFRRGFAAHAEQEDFNLLRHPHLRGKPGCQNETRGSDEKIDGGCYVGCGGNVVDAQKVKAGAQAAENRSHGVAAVQKTPPTDAPRGGFNPAGENRQRCAHERRGRQQAYRTKQGAKQRAGQTVTDRGKVNSIDIRDGEEHEDGTEAHAQFEESVNAQRLCQRGAKTRDAGAAETKATHESGEQNTQ